MEIRNSSKHTRVEKIFFDQGEEKGKLYYEATDIGVDITPERFLVDSEGNFIFLENWLSRIQKFSGAGEFLLSYDTPSLYNKLDLDAGSRMISILNIFMDSKGFLRLLIQSFLYDGSDSQYYLVRCNTSGQILDYYSLKNVPETLTYPEISFLDQNDFLWLYQLKWYTFDPEGLLNRVLDIFGTYVDNEGHLYGGFDPIELYDRDGKHVSPLEYKKGPGQDLVDGGSPEHFLFSWNRDVEQIKSEGSTRIPNNLQLFHINKDIWYLQFIEELKLPESRFEFPDPGSEDVIPVEVYQCSSCMLDSNHFYVLGYSNKNYWILKVDVSDFLSKYRYLEKYRGFQNKRRSELQVLRNEIYARHGKSFQSGKMKQYFSSQPWYKVNPSYADDLLSEEERLLAKIILDLERMLEAKEKL